MEAPLIHKEAAPRAPCCCCCSDATLQHAPALYLTLMNVGLLVALCASYERGAAFEDVDVLMESSSYADGMGWASVVYTVGDRAARLRSAPPSPRQPRHVYRGCADRLDPRHAAGSRLAS